MIPVSNSGNDGPDLSQLAIIIINGMIDSTDYPSNLVKSPAGIDWYKIMYANGETMRFGHIDDTNYMCPNSIQELEPPMDDGLVSGNPPDDGLTVYGFNIHPPDPGKSGEVDDDGFNGWSVLGFNPQPEPPALCVEITAVN